MYARLYTHHLAIPRGYCTTRLTNECDVIPVDSMQEATALLLLEKKLGYQL